MFNPIYSPNVNNEEINYLSEKISSFLSLHTNILKLDALFEERYQNFYKKSIGDERRQNVYGWYQSRNIKIGKFYTFDRSFIDDNKFDLLLSKIFGSECDIDRISIQALTNGNYLIPHIDLGNRNIKVKNFPIYNFENSESIFYTVKDNSIQSSIFTFDELEEVARFKYTPNFVHEFDASIPHSVYSTHSGFRLMLSCYS